jgi:CDP-diacylglycerol--glycerol-3-phosphate 3-phosphatidyltransferase
MSEKNHAFGPSAIATPANALTLTRLFAAPLFGVAVAETGHATWLLFVLWFVLGSSDYFDGLVARRHGTTRSGAFLDPLADKFIVLAALCALVVTREVTWVPVALIAAREVAMSGFRVHAGQMGISVPARPLAKLKTLVQDAAIASALIPVIGLHHLTVVRWVLWVAVALTLITGVQYLVDARRTMRAQAKRREALPDPKVV